MMYCYLLSRLRGFRLSHSSMRLNLSSKLFLFTGLASPGSAELLMAGAPVFAGLLASKEGKEMAIIPNFSAFGTRNC